jgi:hypothetical protein
MVKRAADGVAHQQPFGERTAIVSALGTDREPLVPHMGDEHIGVADSSEQHPALGHAGGRDPLREIGFIGSFFFCFHIALDCVASLTPCETALR